jgi:hypothetical protein
MAANTGQQTKLSMPPEQNYLKEDVKPEITKALVHQKEDAPTGHQVLKEDVQPETTEAQPGHQDPLEDTQPGITKALVKQEDAQPKITEDSKDKKVPRKPDMGSTVGSTQA